MDFPADAPDVLVLGGGNAGLCAAITAREAGARVLLLEAAAPWQRGGNSRHTRNLRCLHDAPEDVLTASYREDEYLDDLMRVTGGKTDESLARLAIRESGGCRAWMRAHGAHFQPALSGTLQLSRTNAFFLGGGRALMNAYYRAAERIGVTIVYEADVRALEIRDGAFLAAEVLHEGRTHRVAAQTLVAASGGFEANLEWLREAWGPAADNFIVRGTPHNRGTVLRALLDAGAVPVSDPRQCHAVAIDARSPKFDGGIATRVDCVSLGIVVNRDGDRFYDEGEDFWPKRYAIWGRLIAAEPGQIAYSIIDAKVLGRFMPTIYPGETADTLEALALRLGLAPQRLAETVARYNAAVQPGRFDPTALDDCATEGLAPAKTHWAQRIDRPPFTGYPLRPGITFTYLGVAVDAHARVAFGNAGAAGNVFAAGEIMAGNILGQGYLAGIGMTIGTTFGRIAGKAAAANVRH